MVDEQARRLNEKKFKSWEELPDGGRRYWYDVEGHHGWRAKYVKEVDSNERTVTFCQEIYSSRGELVETHEKYPVDTGHQPPNGGNES